METLHAEFRLANHFPTAVIFQDVLKSCSCADATLSSERIEPGQTATLLVAWKTGAKRGRVGDVLMVRYAGVGGSNPGTLDVSVRATVEPDFVCNPEVITFSERAPGRVVVRLKPGRVASVPRVVTAFATHKAFAVSVDPNTSDVEVRFDPSVEGWKDFRAAVAMRIDGSRQDRLEVPIYIEPGQQPAAEPSSFEE
jgi:hypothetical protein